jgi:hypothetical protein
MAWWPCMQCDGGSTSYWSGYQAVPPPGAKIVYLDNRRGLAHAQSAYWCNKGCYSDWQRIHEPTRWRMENVPSQGQTRAPR